MRACACCGGGCLAPLLSLVLGCGAGAGLNILLLSLPSEGGPVTVGCCAAGRNRSVRLPTFFLTVLKLSGLISPVTRAHTWAQDLFVPAPVWQVHT